MKKIEKVGIGVAIFIALTVGGFFSLPWVLGFFTADIPSIDDRDLQLKKIVLLDSENAYFDLVQGGKVLSLSDQEDQFLKEAAAGKKWDDATARTILEKNALALAFFTTAAEKGKYQNIQLADPFSVTFLDLETSHIHVWRVLNRLSTLRARFLMREGKGTEGLEEALHSIRISSAIISSQGTMIEYLVALGMKEIGINAARDILSEEIVDQALMKRTTAELSNYYDNEKGLENVLKGEYMGSAQITDAIAAGDMRSLMTDPLGTSANPAVTKKLSKKVTNSFYFRPNKTKKIHADMTHALLMNSAKPCGEMQFSGLDPSFRSPIVLYFSDNAIGKLLATVSITSYEGLFTKKCHDDLLVGVLQTMLALKMYKNDTTTFPPTLGVLVPTYLPSVPIDPYDGKPLRYSQAKKILYSIGKDLIDEGGSEGDDWKKMNDPTLPIHFSSP